MLTEKATSDLDLLPAEAVAEIFTTTPAALYSQRVRGERPGSLGIRLGPGRRGRLYWRRSDITAWIAEEATRQHAQNGD